MLYLFIYSSIYVYKAEFSICFFFFNCGVPGLGDESGQGFYVFSMKTHSRPLEAECGPF